MDARELRTRFQDLITREIGHAERLLRHLRDEQASLAEAPLAVERIALEKRADIEQLEQLHRQRIRLLGAAGYSSDRQGMDAFLQQCGPGGELRGQWDRLLSLVEECRANNHVNGMVMEMSRRNIRRTLAILHGKTPQSETYSPSGQTSDSDLSRSLAKA